MKNLIKIIKIYQWQTILKVDFHYQFNNSDGTLGPLWERALASAIYLLLAAFGIIGDIFIIKLFWFYRKTDFKNSFYRLATGLSILDVLSLIGVICKISYE